MNDTGSRRKGYTGLVIAGGLLLGPGIGFAIDEIPAGLFIGLGGGITHGSGPAPQAGRMVKACWPK